MTEYSERSIGLQIDTPKTLELTYRRNVTLQDEIGFYPTDLSDRIVARRNRRDLSKRLFDLLLAPIGLLILSPFYALAALAILIEDGRPIHFVQVRSGRDGKPFKCLKLRSMIKDAEKGTGPQWAKVNDPRVTRTGRILRKTRIDEVPQFVCVILGTMSLVGPRPMRQHFVDKIAEADDTYRVRQLMTPGITGPSQVFTKAADTTEDHLVKMKYDIQYGLTGTLVQDVKLLFLTLFDALKSKGRA